MLQVENQCIRSDVIFWHNKVQLNAIAVISTIIAVASAVIHFALFLVFLLCFFILHKRT